jgi:hypothetical protein
MQLTSPMKTAVNCLSSDRLQELESLDSQNQVLRTTRFSAHDLFMRHFVWLCIKYQKHCFVCLIIAGGKCNAMFSMFQNSQRENFEYWFRLKKFQPSTIVRNLQYKGRKLINRKRHLQYIHLK